MSALGRPLLLPAAVVLVAAAAPTPAVTPLLGAAPAHAAPADTLTLTLELALSVARASNPAYRRAVNDTGLNGSEWRRTVFDEVLPHANLRLFNTDYNGNISRVTTDNFGDPLQRERSEWRFFSNTTQGVTLDWSIQGASILHALDGQRLANLGREVAETRALTDAEVAVRRAFWDALEQREVLRVEEELLGGRETDRTVAERLFGLALKTRVDVLNAELEVERQTLAIRRQRTVFEKALLTLRTEMGDADLGPFRLAETPLPDVDPSALDADRLVRIALDANPELAEAEVAVRSAEVDLKDRRRAWWPQLDARYTANRRVQETKADGLFDVSFDENLDQNFFLTFSVPMFNNYFQNEQDIDRARVDVDNRREDVREARLQTEEDVRGALLELDNERENVRIAERAAEIAAEAVRLSREEYRLGSRSFEDLRDAVDREADARRELVTARHAFVDALIDLDDAVGAPVPPRSPDPGAGPGG